MLIEFHNDLSNQREWCILEFQGEILGDLEGNILGDVEIKNVTDLIFFG